MALEREGIELVIEGVSQFINGLAQSRDALDNFRETAENTGDGLEIASAAMGVVEGGAGILGAAIKLLGVQFDIWKKQIEFALTPLKLAWEGIKKLTDIFITLGGKLKDFVAGAFRKTIDFFGDLAKKIISIPLHILESLWNSLKRIGEIVLGIIIADTFRKLRDWIIDLGRSAVEAAGNFQLLEIRLLGLIARNIARGEEAEEVTNKMIHLTEEELLEIDKLQYEYDNLALKLDETKSKYDAIGAIPTVDPLEASVLSSEIDTINAQLAETAMLITELMGEGEGGLTIQQQTDLAQLQEKYAKLTFELSNLKSEYEELIALDEFDPLQADALIAEIASVEAQIVEASHLIDELNAKASVGLTVQEQADLAQLEEKYAKLQLKLQETTLEYENLGAATGASAAEVNALLSEMTYLESQMAATKKELDTLVSKEGTFEEITRKIRINTMDYADALKIAQEEVEDLWNWMFELSVLTPYGVQDVANVYTLANSYGIAADEAEELTRAITDFASGMGLSEVAMTRIIENFGQMIQQGKITGTELRDLGRGAFVPVTDVMLKAAEAMGAFDASLGISAQELNEFASRENLDPVMLLLGGFVELVGEEFPGAAERMARTLPGVIELLGDTVDILLGLNIVKPVLDQVTSAAYDFFTALALDEEIRNSTREIGDILGEITSQLISDLPTAEGLIDKVRQALQKVVDVLTVWRDEGFREALLELGIPEEWINNYEKFKDGVVALAEKLEILWGWISGDTDWKTALEQLGVPEDTITSLDKLKDTYDFLKERIEEVWEKIKERDWKGALFELGVPEGVIIGLEDLGLGLDALGEWWDNYGGDILHHIAGGLKAIFGVDVAWLNDASSGFEDMAGAFREWAESLDSEDAENAKTFIDDLAISVLAFKWNLENTILTLKSHWTPVFDEFKKLVKNIADIFGIDLNVSIWDTITTLSGLAAALVGGTFVVLNWLVEKLIWVRDHWDKISEGIKIAIGWLFSFADGIIGPISTIWAAFKWLQRELVGESIIPDMLSDIVSEFAHAFWDIQWNIVAPFVAWVIDEMNKLSEIITNILEGLGLIESGSSDVSNGASPTSSSTNSSSVDKSTTNNVDVYASYGTMQSPADISLDVETVLSLIG